MTGELFPRNAFEDAVDGDPEGKLALRSLELDGFLFVYMCDSAGVLFGSPVVIRPDGVVVAPRGVGHG